MKSVYNMNMQEVVQKAEKFALEEIDKYKTPTKIHFQIANHKGLELSKKLKADSDIVQLGTRLMDFKICKAISENRLSDHVKMSAEAAREFLSEFNLPKEKVEKIINCVEGHHKDVPWICKEA